MVTRDGEIIYTQDNVSPGATMSYTDHYLPTVVDYAVYAIVHNAKGLAITEDNVILGPTCNWTVEMSSNDPQGWLGGGLSFVNGAGSEVAFLTTTSTHTNRTVTLPLGHVEVYWVKPSSAITNMSFKIKNPTGERKVGFQGTSSDMSNGLFYIINNTCSNKDEENKGPVNLTASVTGNDVTLNWEMDTYQNIIHYYVFRDDILIAVSEDTHYTDAEAADKFHTYSITAVSTEGETLHSNIGNIVPESPCLTPTNFHYEMVTNAKVKLMWDAPADESVTGYIIYRRVKGQEFKRIKALTNTTYTDNLSTQPDNHFEYAVAAYYSDNDCTSGYASTKDNPDLHFIEVNKTIIPEHLDFLIHEGRVILQWEQATMAVRYNIYRDGQLIGHSLDNDFIDYNSVFGESYYYTVTGSASYVESNPTNEVFVDWTTEVNTASEAQGIHLYPNPTNDKVTIEAEGLRQIRVFNVTGQEVLQQIAEDTRAFIDLSTQPKGCYFIEVVTESGCTTTKVIKL